MLRYADITRLAMPLYYYASHIDFRCFHDAATMPAAPFHAMPLRYAAITLLLPDIMRYAPREDAVRKRVMLRCPLIGAARRGYAWCFVR